MHSPRITFHHFLVDISNVLFFSARGSGRGSLRRHWGGGGSAFLVKIPGGAGFPRRGEGGGGKGPGLRGLGGGFLCSGPKFSPRFIWAAANGGVTNGGLRGVWPPFLEISRKCSPFFCLFRSFPEGAKKEQSGNPETGGKRPFSSDILRFA